MGMSIFDDMNVALLNQIAGKWNGVPVDRIIFLQHWFASKHSVKELDCS